MRGQISAEMIILMALILAVVAIVGMNMISTAKAGVAKMNETSQEILDNATNAISMILVEPANDVK